MTYHRIRVLIFLMGFSVSFLYSQSSCVKMLSSIPSAISPYDFLHGLNDKGPSHGKTIKVTQFIAKGFCINGELNKNCKIYYKNEREEDCLIEEGDYINGKRNGIWKEFISKPNYYIDAVETYFTGEYADGRRVGMWKLIYDNEVGNGYEVYFNKQGKIEKRIGYYRKSNHKIETINYYNTHEKDSLLIFYDEKMNVKEKNTYNPDSTGLSYHYKNNKLWETYYYKNNLCYKFVSHDTITNSPLNDSLFIIDQKTK